MIDPRMMQEQMLRQRQQQMNVSPMNFNPDAGGVNGFAPSMPMDATPEVERTMAPSMNEPMGMTQEPPAYMQQLPQHMQIQQQRMNAMRQQMPQRQASPMGQQMGNPMGGPMNAGYRDLANRNVNQMQMQKQQMMRERPPSFDSQPLREPPSMAPPPMARPPAAKPIPTKPNATPNQMKKLTNMASGVKNTVNKIKKPAPKSLNKPGVQMQGPPTF